jgi:hypothetical protein
MRFIRRRLLAMSFAWLVCQAGSLAAFVPQDCCPAHHQPAEAAKDCHQQATTGDQCPMHLADGKPCPMHDGTGNQDRPCAMRGTCNGPAAALATLFSVPGILVDQSPAPVVNQVSSVLLTRDTSLSLFVPLDTPPPRS